MTNEQPPKVRKFAPGTSSIYFFDFLESCGYCISSANGHRYNVRKGKVGRFKRMTRLEVRQLVDQLRINKGLEPFYKR
jgi:hypothetical protein